MHLLAISVINITETMHITNKYLHFAKNIKDTLW